MSELRWDVRLREWVIVAPHRQDRTYLPVSCPLCPGVDGDTELPTADFEIAVFENRFASLRTDVPLPPVLAGGAGGTIEPSFIAGVAMGSQAGATPSYGRCEVVVYTPEHEGSLGSLPVERVEALVRVWAHRYDALSRLHGIRYVFIFENRGEEIGVTLSHPHGQIYAYPFMPPYAAREQAIEADHLAQTNRCLHCDIIESERASGSRMLIDDGMVAAYVPYAAHWSYEVHIAVRNHRTSLSELDARERRGLAAALKSVLQAYDRLFERPMPYMLAVRQRAISGDAHEGAHLRIEILPALRTETKLKFRAGSETFMGAYINDVEPEVAAANLLKVL